VNRAAATHALPRDTPGDPAPGLPQAAFDDLYSAVYEILDDAKTSHNLIKLYKGSHAAAQPHPAVLDFGTSFLSGRQGLLGYACRTVNPEGPPAIADLEHFDRAHAPRISTRAVFDLLLPGLRRCGESDQDVLAYLASRTHPLGAYRGGSSGLDDEARAFAAAHFRSTGLNVTPEDVLVFCGGAKGAFLAFCAALMLHRDHDDLHRAGGLMLAPAGYYQSLRLIPAMFGGDIHVTPELTGDIVREWLHGTSRVPRRCIYIPLVNNADGHLLTRPEACSLAHAILEHNAAHPGRPVFVLADDVYAGSYLTPGRTGTPIASLTGADVGRQMIEVDPPQGGWYVPLRMSKRLIPGAASSVDAFAVLMHYGEARPDTGIALLPGELFGYRHYDRGFMLRATLAAHEQELGKFTGRLRDAITVLAGPDGPRIAGQALRRARTVADVDTILGRCRY
jgi:aspartate/methionine/tyrosine aminotransferase